MARFVLRRIGTALIAIVGGSMLVFLIVFALPGDKLAAFGGRDGLDSSARAAFEQRYHLNDPLTTQYLHWSGRLIRGDLGESRQSRRPVRSIIKEALPSTTRLAAGAFAIELLVGIAAGVLAAVTKRPLLRALVLVSTTLTYTVPVFVMASSLQYLLGVRWGLVPISGADAGLRSWIVPSVVLALPSIAVVSRITQSSVERSGRSGYVELAMAKGISRRRIVTHHRLRNGLIPVVTFLGLDLAALFGGALFVESVFNLPGMGLATTKAVAQRDAELVVGCTLVLIAIFIVTNLLVDVIVAGLDPRARDD